jgi:hypothetical protein
MDLPRAGRRRSSSGPVGVQGVFFLSSTLRPPFPAHSCPFLQCLMLVLFQRRIIYLPSVPPGTKNESLTDGERTSARDASLSGMNWQEVETESAVPTRWFRRRVVLKGIELSWKGEGKKGENDIAARKKGQKVVVIYLQGVFCPSKQSR